jgi:DDE superfamily endonuclease
MVQLEIEDRWRIVTFMKQSGGDVCFTAKHTPCHMRVVRHWWKRYQETGNVNVAERSGRPRLISSTDAKTALNLLMHKDSKGATHVARQLAIQGITKKVVSKGTIINAARRAAVGLDKKLVVVRGAPAKGLREVTKEKRFAFATANLNRDWGKVLFTDRKRFYLNYPGSKVKPARWVFEGEVQEGGVFQPTNPQCVNVYAGISPYGMTLMHVVAGTSKHTTNYKTKQGKPARSITSAEYKQVLQQTLLPEGARLFTKRGINTWHLQQDNDPTHGVAGEVVKQWNQSHGSCAQLLPNWPPSSPDLNIIENVWAWVQQKVNQQGCPCFDQFKQAIEAAIAEVPEDMISNLYKSMHTRLELVIANGGGLTWY